MNDEFDCALSVIADRISRVLQFISNEIKQTCEEIRLRAGQPLCLTVKGKVMLVCKDSSVSAAFTQNGFTVTQDDINKSLSRLCNNSVYLHEEEIKQGFVSVKGGYRAGVCGSFNADGMLVSVSSINLRIARQIFDCALPLLPFADSGLLIAGPPGCGKTTMLRDIVRLLSNGAGGAFYRVAVIDSRSEISGGNGVFDLGFNTDVLFTSNKAIGSQIALRTMFPNIIAFDEIGTVGELQGVADCFNAGVSIITTAHCKTADDLMRREIIKSIIKSEAISFVALIGDTPDKPLQIIDVKRLRKSVFD